MYTLMDRNTVKRDSDSRLMTKDSPSFQEFIDFCDAGGMPAVDNSDLYEKVQGEIKGKKYFRLKVKSTKVAQRIDTLKRNIYIERGDVIYNLCQSVIKYITGKNDSTITDPTEIDAMLATYEPILQLLSVNRHTSAKALIDAIEPTASITQADLDYISEVYGVYEARIAEIEAKLGRLNG